MGKYVQSDGLNTEADYPYQHVQHNCRQSTSNPIYKCSGCVWTNEGVEHDLKMALVQEGPVALTTQILTMLSLLLAMIPMLMVISTGLSRTHGANPGEHTDTSNWPAIRTICVELQLIQYLQKDLAIKHK